MKRKDKFTICFADITVSFRFPEAIDLPVEFEEFLVEDLSEGSGKEPDAEYEIQFLDQPLPLPASPLLSYNGMQVFQTEEGTIRNYTPLTEKDGCQVACLIRESGKHTLYYPRKKWGFYSQELHLLHLIGIEEVMMRRNALLLHSSVVQIGGNAILFSGPSGIGKSTQARLWEEHLDAQVVNGDRCVIRRTEEGFVGAGSPWCGTSRIYSKEQAPIKGIFILKQSPTNSIRRLKGEAFVALYSQCIVNTWNKEFTEQMSALLTELISSCPVYELSCRPDTSAVELAYHTIFE